MVEIGIGRLPLPSVEDGAAEIVERKGRGHPDSICDALAEELSLGLSRFYRERFGVILHHNVDKVLLWGGQARSAFGGGEVVRPMEIYLSGRATFEHGGVKVPVEALAVEGSRAWLARNLHGIDPEHQVVIHPLIRPGSRDLVDLHLRAAERGVWLANDTSCGVGYAPLSRLERAVMAVERRLTGAETVRHHPALGEDVKVMGLRRGAAVELTVACPIIDRHVANLDAYRAEIATVADLACEAARAEAAGPVSLTVNAADDYARASVYTTVTGTSAEAGDDGQAGRGNRVNGLIAPYRPMTMESTAGKNPVTHVGKLYNLAAGLLAESLVSEVAGIVSAQVYLVSRIGAPVAEPALVDVKVATREGWAVDGLAGEIESLAREQLRGIGELWRGLLTGELAIDRWPLRQAGIPA